MFAYDLDEPDVCAQLLKLGSAQRLRVILDNPTLHNSTTAPKPEDTFTTKLRKRRRRGRDPARPVRALRPRQNLHRLRRDGPRTVLTGSTNFSVTGLYVNANHVLVFDDRQVAATYSQVFNEAWTTGVKRPIRQFPWAAKHSPSAATGSATPPTTVTFAPHTPAFADAILTAWSTRINAEGHRAAPAIGSAFFAVMDIDEPGNNPVYAALRDLPHQTRRSSASDLRRAGM